MKVEAHQDDGRRYGELSFEAKRNVDCDELSGKRVKEVVASEYVQEADKQVRAIL